jgi:hypothetical protein
VRVSTTTFTGQSGQRYQYFVYTMKASFKSTGAVYAIGRRYSDKKGGYRYDVLFVGETSDLATSLENRSEWNSFAQRYANCICTHLDNDRDSRLAKREDLLRHYAPGARRMLSA